LPLIALPDPQAQQDDEWLGLQRWWVLDNVQVPEEHQDSKDLAESTSLFEDSEAAVLSNPPSSPPGAPSDPNLCQLLAPTHDPLQLPMHSHVRVRIAGLVPRG
jgi:hypothetical protein